jgi:hypothetical protein
MAMLKTLVVVMGFMIIAGVGLLGYGIYQKANNPDFTFFSTEPETTAAEPAKTGLGDVSVSLPQGCSIVDMRPDGQRLFLRIGPSGPCERVVVIDLDSGAVMGTVTVDR